MHSLPSRSRLAGGLVLLALAGCRSYSPAYPTYGPPGYAPVYSPPATLGAPSAIPPQGTIIQDPNAFPPSGPGTGQPYPTPVEPFPSSPQGDPWPTPNGAAPFNGEPSQPPASQPDPNLVPNYGDPNEFDSFDNTNHFEKDTTNRTGSATPDVFSQPSPFQPDFRKDGGSAQVQDAQASGGPVFADAEMQPTVRPASATRPVQTPAVEPVDKPAEPNPFDYDRQNYRWLRGVVEQDEQDGTWHILYDPTEGDRHGGQMPLIAPAAEFQRLKVKPGDVVLVEGTVEPSADGGTSQYRVSKLMGPLVPKDQ